MNDLTDQQLLRDYAERRSEAAFTELVRRHIDLVHSAAFRLTGEAHSAQDVTQAVFVALAQNAGRLTYHPVLSGWLHTTARNLAAKSVRAAVRRHNHEQEAAAMNEVLSAAPEASWEEIAPHLDAALGELTEPERNAVLLRYFERKSAGEIAGILGISDEAAQKRVSRAVERLRGFFAKRGVTVGAGGLAVVISANAVQAAPTGLVISVSATAIAGTAVTTAAVAATTTATIAMTTLQKTLVAATLAVLAGAGIYEARQAAKLRDKVQTLQRQQAPLAGQVEQLTRERHDLTTKLSAMRDENERLNRSTAELLKLRGEVARLRRDSEELVALRASDAKDPSTALLNTWLSRVQLLKQRLRQTPEANIPELQSLTEEDWLNAVKEDLNTDADFRRALSRLRNSAETKYGYRIQAAVEQYSRTNGGRLPADLSLLKPYLKPSIDDAILQRYEIVPADSLPTITLPGAGGWVITQKAAVDLEYDTRFALAKTDGGLGCGGGGSFAESEMVKSLTPAIKAYFSANAQGTLSDPTQLAPYVTTPEARALLERAIKWYEESSPENRADALKRLERLRPN